MTQFTLGSLSVRNAPTPLVAIDLVLLTIEDGLLKVLMCNPASDEGGAVDWVLPGAIVQFTETVEAAAARVLRDKANLEGLGAEQFHVFSAVDRDPRDRIISVGFVALVPFKRLHAAASDRLDLRLAEVWQTNGAAQLGERCSPVSAGYDHALIIGRAVEYLRSQLDQSVIGFGLLPDQFTLLELLNVHEIVRGRGLNKPAFRKRLLDAQFPDGRRVVPTGTFTTGRAHRPAELYQLSDTSNP